MSDSKAHPLLSAFLVKGYKLVGVLILFILLIGIVFYLIRSGFYMVDNTWSKPRTLLPSDKDVIAASRTFWDYEQQRGELESKRAAAETQLTQVDKDIIALTALQKQVHAQESAKSKGSTLDQLNYAKLVFDIDSQIGALTLRKQQLSGDLKTMGRQLTFLTKKVESMRDLPRVRAAISEMQVLFVPYENESNVSKGDPVYSCSWGLVNCDIVGYIGDRLDGETVDTRPNNDERVRGYLINIKYTKENASKESVLFVGKKPFYLF